MVSVQVVKNCSVRGGRVAVGPSPALVTAAGADRFACSASAVGAKARNRLGVASALRELGLKVADFGHDILCSLPPGLLADDGVLKGCSNLLAFF